MTEPDTGSWPAKWSAHLRRDWERAGGTPESAIQLQQAGWTSKDAQSLTSSGIPLQAISVPARAAKECRRWGDDLVGLVSAYWPEPPEGTTMSIKRIDRSGRRSRSFVVAGPEVRSLQDWRHEAGEWRCSDLDERQEDRPATELPDSLFEIRLGVAYEFVAAELDVVDRLMLIDPGVDEDPEAWQGEAAQVRAAEDEELSELLEGTQWLHRWVRVNGDRAVPVLTGSKGAKDVCFVLIDPVERELHGQDVIAEWSWFSESGGAPISWDGGNRIVRVGRGALVFQQWGDFGQDLSVEHGPRTDADLAGILAHWIRDVDAAIPFAFTRMDFDPQGVLDGAERERWEELLAGPHQALTLDLAVHAPVEGLIEERLAGDPRFRAIAEAFQNPLSGRGQALREALEHFEDDGVIGSVLSGWWSD